MRPDPKEKLEILKLEMDLIQGIFNKYDDLIFRNRNWFITLWSGAIGLAITTNQSFLALLGVVVSIIYWIMEGMMRYQYWYKYVVRYRAIRSWLNESEVDAISIYDLTNHYGTRSNRIEKIRNSFIKPEPSLLFGLLFIGAVAVFIVIDKGIISAIAT